MKTQYKDSQYTLRIEQIEQLINATKNLRDKLIISSCYFPALRRFEVAKMKVEDIDFERGRIIVTGKFNKIAPIPVGAVYPQYMKDLQYYLQFIKRKSGYIFSNDGKKPIDKSRINQIFLNTSTIAHLTHPNPKPIRRRNRISKEIYEKHRKINPHLLRHSQARHLKDFNFSIEFIKNYMRHDSIQSTMDIYGTQSIDDMERYALEKRGIQTNILIR